MTRVPPASGGLLAKAQSGPADPRGSGNGGGSLLRRYLRDTPTAPTSTVLALPLLVFYGIGILIFSGAQNGADLVTRTLWSLLAPLGTIGYLGFYGVVVLVAIGMAVYLSGKQRFDPAYFWPLLIESGIYAVATGFASSFLTSEILSGVGLLGVIAPATGLARLGIPGQHGPIEGLVVSAGAGLHEEFVFRVIGIGLVARAALGTAWRKPSRNLLLVVIVSSLAFSLAHYLGEPFAVTTFVYRIAAGLFFAAVFLFRGFAVAAWTHALYDVWVISVLGR